MTETRLPIPFPMPMGAAATPKHWLSRITSRKQGACLARVPHYVPSLSSTSRRSPSRSRSRRAWTSTSSVMSAIASSRDSDEAATPGAKHRQRPAQPLELVRFHDEAAYRTDVRYARNQTATIRVATRRQAMARRTGQDS